MVTEIFSRPFERMEHGLGAGYPAPSGWRRISDCPLVIIVGVTGVGKSTMLSHLGRTGRRFTLLPDRRTLTDRLIIGEIQIADGVPVKHVRDRGERFNLTRRYRARYPGGMAQALATLWIDPSETAPLLVFDGLRGTNEVAYAASTLPHARFVLLDAPDWVRLRRLLGRNDDFDHVAGSHMSAANVDPDAVSLDVLGVESLFSPTEMSAMLEWVQTGAVSLPDLRAKLSIAVEERRSYDPGATRETLLDIAFQRTLYIDTVRNSPEEAAVAVTTWLGD